MKTIIAISFFILCHLKVFCFTPVDSIYDSKVKTVQFYQYLGIKKDVVLPPILRLYDSLSLRLEFDILEDNPQPLEAKVFLCDAEWNLTETNEVNYLEEYNEFDILDRDYSFATKVHYTHYSFDVPTILLPGNYVLTVSNTDTQYPILSRRFSVYDNKVKITRSPFQTHSNLSTKQQIDFSVDFSALQINNPLQDVRVYVRKSGRHDKQSKRLKASFYKAYENTLQFFLMDGSNTFEAGNTFRKIDMRSTDFKGLGIADIDLTGPISEVYLFPDESRRFKNPDIQPDIQGRYLIDHYEFDDGAINSDYLLTLFTLQHPKVKGDVYVYGALSDWKLKEDFKMSFDDELQLYTAAPVLKQGY